MKLGDYIQTADFKKEKHAPVIEVPENIPANTAVNIQVTVGKDIPHPNTVEHYIAWIALYFKGQDEKFVRELGKIEFSSHVEGNCTEPQGLFHVKFSKPGTLIATSYCNLHGLWESSLDITLS